MIQSKLFFEQIIATISEGLFVVDERGYIILCNDAFAQMTGYSRGEALKAQCTLLNCDLCNNSRAISDTHWCIMFEKPEEGQKQCVIRRKDGAWLPVVKNARVLHMEDGSLCLVETIKDISVLMEQELQLTVLSRLLETEKGFMGLVGASPPMQKMYRVLERAASSDAPVLLLGESGTGKELAAHALHMLSDRRDKPYVSVNCTALNDAVLESELFGHVRGAFTGATRNRQGRFGAACGGTLFLDEIGDISLATQVKLLRVLESGEYQAVGESACRRADVRLVTATNRSLEHLVRQGLFREDLLFRIRVIPVHLPSLRERAEDIPPLVQHLLERMARRTGKPVPRLTAPTLAALCAHSWPGNVRELKNVLEYAVALAGSTSITPEHLPPLLLRGDLRWGGTAEGQAVMPTEAAVPLDAAEVAVPPSVQGKVTRGKGASEKADVLRALESCDGNISRAATVLGIHRSTLHARMNRLGITRSRFQ